MMEEKQIDMSSLDLFARILHAAIPVAGDIQDGAEREVARVGGNRAGVRARPAGGLANGLRLALQPSG